MTFDCRETHEHLNGWIDGQLDAEAAREVEAHLASCAACRQEADGRRLEHEQLVAAFTPRRDRARRVAEAVVSRLPTDSAARHGCEQAAGTVEQPSLQQSDRPTEQRSTEQRSAEQRSHERQSAGVTPRPTRGYWMVAHWLLAAAAGFLAAVLVFRPWEQSAVVETPRGAAVEVTPAGLARLAVATGPVEYSPEGGLQFFTCPDNASLGSGTRVRTPQNARCELDLEPSARLRLNDETQMRLAGPRRIELDKGRLWFEVAHAGQPYAIDAGAFEVTAAEATLDCSAAPPDAALLVLSGSATVKAGGWQEVVAAGERLEVAGGKMSKREPLIDPIVETRWVNDILIQKGPQDEELRQRIDRLWAQVGRAKMTHLYEAEIRSLGSRCTTPLTRYIQSPDSLEEPQKRAAAARILADVAQPESIPDLISLLSDSSGDVRSCAARALERLTGENFGRRPEAWQAESWGACQPTAMQWKSWWETARSRYPGAKDTVESSPPLQKKS